MTAESSKNRPDPSPDVPVGSLAVRVEKYTSGGISFKYAGVTSAFTAGLLQPQQISTSLLHKCGNQFPFILLQGCSQAGSG